MNKQRERIVIAFMWVIIMLMWISVIMQNGVIAFIAFMIGIGGATLVMILESGILEKDSIEMIHNCVDQEGCDVL